MGGFSFRLDREPRLHGDCFVVLSILCLCFDRFSRVMLPFAAARLVDPSSSSSCRSDHAIHVSLPTPPPSPPLQSSLVSATSSSEPRTLQSFALHGLVSAWLAAMSRHDGGFVGRQISRMPPGLLRVAYCIVLAASQRWRTADALFRLRCRLYAELNGIPCSADDTFADHRDRLLRMPFLRRLPRVSAGHSAATDSRSRKNEPRSRDRGRGHGWQRCRRRESSFRQARVALRDLAILASLPTDEPPCFATASTHYASHYAYVCTTGAGERVRVCGLCRRSPSLQHRGTIETAVTVYHRRAIVERLIRNRSNWCALCGRAALFVLWSFTNDEYDNDGETATAVRAGRSSESDDDHGGEGSCTRGIGRSLRDTCCAVL